MVASKNEPEALSPTTGVAIGLPLLGRKSNATRSMSMSGSDALANRRIPPLVVTFTCGALAGVVAQAVVGFLVRRSAGAGVFGLRLEITVSVGLMANFFHA